MSNPLKIAIVGAGAAGYFAAAAIRRNCPDTDVTVIYDPKTPSIGVGESIAWNGPEFFHKYLGLNNDFAWLRKSGSTFKHSVALTGFHNDKKLFHTTAPVNASYRVFNQSVWDGLSRQIMMEKDEHTIWDVLMHLWAKGLLNVENPQHYASEKFWFVEYNKSPVDLKGNFFTSKFFSHSYHINADSIRHVIHDMVGKPNGVKELPIRLKSVELDADGNIDHLLLDNNEKFHADLYIDASGFARLLMKKLPYEFEHCDEYFNNCSLVGRHTFADHGEHNSHTLHHAMDHGWRFSVPFNNRSGEGYQFNSRIFDRQDQLVDEYYAKTGNTDVDFRLIKWEPGYYKDTFVKNCMAIGISYGFSDVFDANNFSATLRQIAKLVECIKQDHQRDFGWKDNYNKFTRSMSWDIVFRIQTGLHLATRNDTEYWRAMTEAGKKFDTKQKLIDAFFDPQRKMLTFARGNHSVYSQHMFLNQAFYHGIELPKSRYIIDIDQHTERQALLFFNYFKDSYKLRAENSMSVPEFFKAIYPNLDTEKAAAPELYHDFLG